MIQTHRYSKWLFAIYWFLMVHPWNISLVSNVFPEIYTWDICGAGLKFHTIHCVCEMEVPSVIICSRSDEGMEYWSN